jgi:hypothetical protein
LLFLVMYIILALKKKEIPQCKSLYEAHSITSYNEVYS